MVWSGRLLISRCGFFDEDMTQKRPKATVHGTQSMKRTVSSTKNARPSAFTAEVDPTQLTRGPRGRKAPTAGELGTDVPQGRRNNKRSEQTMRKIFDATEQIILESGVERISILDVCRTADMSRGTFYRYFDSQEDLLDAFSQYKRESFHQMLAKALESCDDPDERLATMVNYLEEYLANGNPRRMILVAPAFALKFFKRIFRDAVARFQVFLAPVFEAWDESLGVKLDRELICDLMVRLVMSEQLVEGEAERGAIPRQIGQLVTALRSASNQKSTRPLRRQMGRSEVHPDGIAYGLTHD